jgi:hypothetical protein
MPSAHKYRYGPGAVVQVDSLQALAAGMNIDVITHAGKVKKSKRNFISVDLPVYLGRNIFPFKTNQNRRATLLTQAFILDAATVTAANLQDLTKARVHGRPLNHPQRKFRTNKRLGTQLFVFPIFAYTSAKVSIVVRSLHHFYEDDVDTSMVTFAQRQAVAVKVENVDVVA